MPTGEVASFDDGRGYGFVRTSGRSDEHFFHCTAITDGSRTIDVGTAVSFRLSAGHLGRWEAVEVCPLPTG